MINRFKGEYHFLSNFFKCSIKDSQGRIWSSVEAWFQAMKCAYTPNQDDFIYLSAVEARKLGRRVRLRSDWHEVRLSIMKEIVHAKFTQNEDLRERLLDTGDNELIEGNTWGDSFWGVCRGKGQNHLGNILMAIREKLR